MKVLITGGAGFLGARLTQELLRLGEFSLAGAHPERIDEIVLVDQVAPRGDPDPRVTAVVGDLVELLPMGILDGTDLVFHLAAVVSGEAESNFDLGMRVNLDATTELLTACRLVSRSPRLVFASSLAVFGSTEQLPLPSVVTDSTLPTPQSSYGTQKFIGELLVADYARRGLVAGRTVRLMTVSVRPGAPNAAASGFLSGLIREPINGIRSASPVAPETRVALSSPARTIEGLLRAASATDAEWGPLTALTLPSLTTTVGDMVAALGRVAGDETAQLVDWVPDPTVADIVTTWPAEFETARAHALGLTADPDFDTVIRAYLAELGGAA